VSNYSVGSWPRRRARINPSSTALRQGEQEITFGSLAERVDNLARAMHQRGVRPGDRVAYLGANDTATFEVFFAAGLLGAIFAPFNIRLTAAELSLLVDDCAPVILFHGSAYGHLVADLPPIATVVAVDGSPAYEEFLATGADSDMAFPEVQLDDDAVILYTSGTTGQAKGAVLTHANVTFNVMNQLAHADVLGSDTAMCIAPLFHATGLGQVSLPTLFKGGCVVVMERFDAGTVLATIHDQQVASFSAVPTMLQMLCDHPDFAATDLSSLRYVIYGGSMVAERVARAWQNRGVVLLQGYGMTEASPGVYLATAAGAVVRPVSIGVPHFFTDVAIADPVGTNSPTGQPPTGQPSGGESYEGQPRRGELLVRGLNVFRGYWQRPVETEAAFTDGWFRSGDVIRLDEDGWAYVVDRVKDMIISGGENVYPAEVEARLNELDGVVESAVIAVPDERWGEVGLAYVVTTAPSKWSEPAIREALRDRLAAFKIPAYVRFIDDLPKTAIGKTRKQVLRATANEGKPHDS
jgi:fatty-acyl-CoA synthase